MGGLWVDNCLKQYLFNNTLINRATPYVKIAVVCIERMYLNTLSSLLVMYFPEKKNILKNQCDLLQPLSTKCI